LLPREGLRGSGAVVKAVTAVMAVTAVAELPLPVPPWLPVSKLKRH